MKLEKRLRLISRLLERKKTRKLSRLEFVIVYGLDIYGHDIIEPIVHAIHEPWWSYVVYPTEEVK